MQSMRYEWDERIVAIETKTNVVFQRVNANDITDNLIIEIVSVNGVDLSKNTDYIKITSR